MATYLLLQHTPEGAQATAKVEHEALRDDLHVHLHVLHALGLAVVLRAPVAVGELAVPGPRAVTRRRWRHVVRVGEQALDGGGTLKEGAEDLVEPSVGQLLALGRVGGLVEGLQQVKDASGHRIAGEKMKSKET